MPRRRWSVWLTVEVLVGGGLVLTLAIRNDLSDYVFAISAAIVVAVVGIVACVLRRRSLFVFGAIGTVLGALLYASSSCIIFGSSVSRCKHRHFLYDGPPRPSVFPRFDGLGGPSYTWKRKSLIFSCDTPPACRIIALAGIGFQGALLGAAVGVSSDIALEFLKCDFLEERKIPVHASLVVPVAVCCRCAAVVLEMPVCVRVKDEHRGAIMDSESLPLRLGGFARFLFLSPAKKSRKAAKTQRKEEKGWRMDLLRRTTVR